MKLLTVKVKMPDPSRTDEQAVLLRQIKYVVQRLPETLAKVLVEKGTHEYTTKSKYQEFLAANPHLKWNKNK